MLDDIMHKCQLCESIERIIDDVISCASMDELQLIKQRAISIRNGMSINDFKSVCSPITSRIETGPTQIGWGKGKDE